MTPQLRTAASVRASASSPAQSIDFYGRVLWLRSAIDRFGFSVLSAALAGKCLLDVHARLGCGLPTFFVLMHGYLISLFILLLIEVCVGKAGPVAMMMLSRTCKPCRSSHIPTHTPLLSLAHLTAQALKP